MFNKVKKIFKLSNWKRWAISSISLVSMTLGIALGSVYGVTNNKPTINYKSGAEVVLKITDLDDTPEVIKRQVEQRLKLSLPSDSSYAVTLNSNDFLTITGTNVDTNEQMNFFKSFISSKDKTTVTTQSLGLNGKPKELSFNFSNATMTNDSISLDLKTPSYSKENILVWKNLSGLMKLAVAEYNNEWTSAEVNKDPYKFLYINGITEDVENGPKAILKTESFGGFDATDYLISKNTAPEDGVFSTSLNLDFAFAPKITKQQKEEIFYNLDFSVSPYLLNIQAYNFISPTFGNNASQFLMIAAIVAFSFIAIFLIINYGLLGALSTICAAFLIFLGLLMITVFRGDYSAEAIAALMLAVGIGLDFNIVFFERFKKELKLGNGLQKSLKKADKLTISSSIAKAMALVLTSTIIYVAGSLYLGTFSALVLIMSIFISIVMLALIRILTNLILGTKVFDDKIYLFGIYKKRNKSKIKSINLKMDLEKKQINPLEQTLIIDTSTSNSRKVGICKKASALFLGIFAVVGATLFTTFSLLGSSWVHGFHSNGALTNPTVLKSTNSMSEIQAKHFADILQEELGIASNEITLKLADKTENSPKPYVLEVFTNKIIDDQKILELRNQGLFLINYSILAEDANQSILHVMYIALATIIIMTIFVLIKTDWSYALTMFFSLIAAIILFIVLFTFQIFTFNTFFIFGLSSAILIAVSNNLSILFRIKEKLKNKKTEELTKAELTGITDLVVKDSFKRLLISNGILMITLLLFTIFPGAQNIFFTIPLMIFILMSLVISTVILPYLFTVFKAFKSRRKREKILNNYWETQNIQEQIFLGINDIK